MLPDNWVIVENYGTKYNYKTYIYILFFPLPKRGYKWEVQSADMWNYTHKSDLGSNKKYTVEELLDTSDLQL